MDDQPHNAASGVLRAAVFAGIAGVVFAAGWFLFTRTKGNEMNPYEYNLDEFRKVPAALLAYDERELLAPGVAAPAGIAVDAEDRLCVAGADAFAVFASDLSPIGRYPLQAPARAVATANGNVYVGAGDHVDVYGASGAFESSWGSLGEDARISGIAAGQGGVYVAELTSRLVWHFDASGTLIGQIGRPNPGADYQGFRLPGAFFDVALAPGGALLAANPGMQRIERYSPGGTLESTWGKASMDIDGFCGCCNPTHIAAGPGGAVVTSEKGLPRVKVYNGEGALEAVVAGPDAFEEGALGLDLAVDSTGRIFVLDPAAGKVRVFTRKAAEVK